MAALIHSTSIELRGVRVHNLQNIDLDIPLGKLIVVTGVSGSGKSSLAFDTLYAEGQRRYVESFSTYARRFLERFEKPDADRIEPIPPAIAVRQSHRSNSRRATVGTTTEIYDSLRLLFAKIGKIICPQCQHEISRQNPTTVHQWLAESCAGRRFILTFRLADFEYQFPQNPSTADGASHRQSLLAAGFNRIIADGHSLQLQEDAATAVPWCPQTTLVVVDRLTVGTNHERLLDSLELAFRQGHGTIVILVESGNSQESTSLQKEPGSTWTVDGRSFSSWEFSVQLRCPGCRAEFADPEPGLFNFNSPLGACGECRGLGVATEPSDSKPASSSPCTACGGSRLQPAALAVRIAGMNIHDWASLTATKVQNDLSGILANLPTDQRPYVEPIQRQIFARLKYLQNVGLGYLTLDRPIRSLSVGEAQRVRLTAMLGSNLVDMLYVLDEPTAGLHPRDTEKLLTEIARLRNTGNTVVMVEHDPAVIGLADEIIDLGPAAGRAGGQVIFQGPPEKLMAASESLTAASLRDHSTKGKAVGREPRSPTDWIRLTGIEHHNLHQLDVDFPLGVLCAITGVSGSGKSSLIEETFYPALQLALFSRHNSTAKLGRATNADASPRLQLPPTCGHYKAITGFESVDEVWLVDQSPIGKSGRANPATFLNLFGDIRTLFATTTEAQVHNFTAAHFSFNAAGGGRCETCAGSGRISIDLQFLPDVVRTCPDCQGTRFRREILESRYRGLSIAEVLKLTIGEAFGFFRGQHRLQRRLKILKDMGLEYLTLGQPADTLSGGESQRLKLAAFLVRATRNRTLFVLVEPTTGLHPADVARLLEVLHQMVATGHSIIAIEHNLDFISQVDYLMELGPEAGEAGGQIVAQGTPGEVAKSGKSPTGRFLSR
ncbi:MAG: excinuclease ABC subunit UvrA [Planctomycetes bacterium]|nr:excinuclease ABC subunit UvrA [Planctomycetota bacterium]